MKNKKNFPNETDNLHTFTSRHCLIALEDEIFQSEFKIISDLIIIYNANNDSNGFLNSPAAIFNRETAS